MQTDALLDTFTTLHLEVLEMVALEEQKDYRTRPTTLTLCRHNDWNQIARWVGHSTSTNKIRRDTSTTIQQHRLVCHGFGTVPWLKEWHSLTEFDCDWTLEMLQVLDLHRVHEWPPSLVLLQWRISDDLSFFPHTTDRIGTQFSIMLSLLPSVKKLEWEDVPFLSNTVSVFAHACASRLVYFSWRISGTIQYSWWKILFDAFSRGGHLKKLALLFGSSLFRSIQEGALPPYALSSLSQLSSLTHLCIAVTTCPHTEKERFDSLGGFLDALTDPLPPPPLLTYLDVRGFDAVSGPVWQRMAERLSTLREWHLTHTVHFNKNVVQTALDRGCVVQWG